MSRQRSKMVVNNEIPLVQTLELSYEQVTAHLSRLSARSEPLVIRVKDSAQGRFRPMGRLGEMHEALLNRRIWAAEVAYDDQGTAWVDTFDLGPTSVVLTRQLSCQAQPAVLSA